MSNILYEWYVSTKKLIKEAETHKDDSKTQEMINEWQSALEAMESGCPGLKEQYERRAAIQRSFTPEQIDHICYIIGDWYIEWKDRIIVDLEKGTHKLGFAKEQLKTMICGDE